MARGAISLLARASARRHWKSLLTAGALLVLGGAVSLAAFAGARRTSSAADRALEDAAIADVSVDVASIDPDRLDRLRELPEVEDLSTYAFTAVTPVGSGLVPGIDVVGVLPLDDRSGRTMDRPRLLSGRLPRTDRIDEVVVNSTIADALDLHVGDPLELESYSQSELLQVFESAEPPAPTGARGRARVVGIGKDLAEIVDPASGGFGVVLLSYAWFERFGQTFDTVEEYDAEAGLFRVLLRARLRGGQAAVDGYLGEVAEVYADSDVTSLFAEARSDVFGDAEATLRVEALALALCAIASAVATCVAVGQALTRRQHLAAGQSDPVTTAVGLPRRDRMLALLVLSGMTIAAGIAGAVVAAAAASSVFPRGLGRRLEPNPGPTVDLVALIFGAAVLGGVVMLACVVGALRSTRSRDPRRALVPRVRISLGWPEIDVGVRMALHAGRGPTRVPVRQTVIGAAIGVAGVVAAIIFGASLDHLVDTPRLYGSDFDTTIVLQGDAGDQARQIDAELVQDRRLAGVTRYGLSEVVVEDQSVAALFQDVLKGPRGRALLSGRAPSSPSEAAVDPAAIDGPGPEIGDVVRVAGDGRPVDIRVVGHLTGTGAEVVMAEPGARLLGVEGYDESGFDLRWAQGVDVEVAQASLEEDFAEVYGVTPPQPIANLERVSGFPYAVAVLLAVLAVAAVGHLLASGVRRRARDLAILKAFGFSRRQTQATVRWQVATLTMIATVTGVILGTAIGREAWALVTTSLRVPFEPAVPAVGLLAVVAGAFAITLTIAAVPARVAARTAPAVLLRSE